MPITHTLARTTAPWHRLDVRHWGELDHTSVSVSGVLDTEAVEAIDRVSRVADAQRHTLSIELREISSVTPEALEELFRRALDHRRSLRRHAGPPRLKPRRFGARSPRTASCSTGSRSSNCGPAPPPTASCCSASRRRRPFISPGAFLATAERFGLTRDRPLGRPQRHRLLADDAPTRAPARSQPLRRVDRRSRLPPLIERELAATGVDPSRLVFELTETARQPPAGRAPRGSPSA